MQEKDLQTDECIERAVRGDREALERLLTGVNDMVFNLSLRLLGTVADAEDAAQDILVRVMTNVSSFRRECAFSTWVYRLALNHLLNCKKSAFAERPLSFEFYGNDIRFSGGDEPEEKLLENERALLAEELKLSCTNVMLQCLDAESRAVFVMGTMFGVDSKTAGEALGISADSYRQKLSRARRKMADFLKEYCALAGGCCKGCAARAEYALAQGRIRREKREYGALKTLPLSVLREYREDMENIDELSRTFEKLPRYASRLHARTLIDGLMNNAHFEKVRRYGEEN